MDNVDAMMVHQAADLDHHVLLDIAYRRRSIRISSALLDELSRRRHAMLDQLASGEAVYGVSTGAGSLAGTRLTEAEQSDYQDALLLARAVGGPPWLDRTETRALVAVRLRTFLKGEPGVSGELCQRLVDLLDTDLLPAVPRGDAGSAGEIIPLAHAFGPLTGIGNFLSNGPSRSSEERPRNSKASVEDILAQAGLRKLQLGPKEGIALLEGVPGSTALSLLHAANARELVQQTLTTAAVGITVLGANRDPYDAATARSDAVLAELLNRLRSLIGHQVSPRALQAPTSFRVVGPVLAHVERAAEELDAAVERALVGVTDSPAFLEGRFVGTAGFHGIDLAGHLDALSASVVHAANVSTARIHRLLDPNITKLTSQLAQVPGPQAGMVAVHKRAAAIVHELRRMSAPSITDTVETSLGQEDVQSFSWLAAQSARDVLDGAREVLACELVALHRAIGLMRVRNEPESHILPEPLQKPMEIIAEAIPSELGDRPFGVDVETIRQLLDSGWATQSE